MKSILKYALVGLLAISTTAYAGNKKKKHSKKAETTMNCPSTCPRTGSCH
jgi:hypothetical protein